MARWLLPLLLAGCSSGTAEPDALLWARSDDSTSLDPAAIDWGEDIKIVQNLFEPLVSFKRDSLELEGKLATAWTVSPDGLRLSFELRPGVTFHDGTPLDAEAVVFTFRRLVDPEHPNRPRQAPFRALYADLAKVEADGPARAVFTLKRPNRSFLLVLTHFSAGIVSPAAARKESFGTQPVGTGPYRLGRWERDVRLELVAFDAHRSPPPIRRVIALPVKSPQTAVAQLERGQVHVVDHPTPAEARALRGARLLQTPSLNVCALGFNMKRAPYDDPGLRRAVSLAIDRAAIVKLAYSGLAEPAINLVPPAVWGDLHSTPEYVHDPALARELVSRLKTRDLELIHVNAARYYMPEPQRLAETLKGQLEAVGFRVSVRSYDRNAYGAKTREEGHPLFILGWKGDYPDPDNYFTPLLHGDYAGDLNGSFWSDPEFNDLVARARLEADPAKRKTLYEQAYKRYRAELPTLPLVHVPVFLAARERVDYTPHPIETRLYEVRFK
jgi:peptide/nickel transport system substrate-binding protein